MATRSRARARLAAVLRLHAAFRQHGRPRLHRPSDPRQFACARPSRRCHTHHLLGRPRPRGGRLLPFRHRRDHRSAGAADCRQRVPEGWPGDPGDMPRCACRRGEDGPSGGDRLRARRRDHRHDDADRSGQYLRAIHRLGRRQEPVSVVAPDDGHLPRARHGHTNDPELHHHLVPRFWNSACRLSSATCSSSISAFLPI